MARNADQHRLVPNRHKPLQLMKGTPMLAEKSALLAVVHEPTRMYLRAAYEAIRHRAADVWEARKVGTRGYIEQPHTCPQFCVGKVGSGLAASR